MLGASSAYAQESKFKGPLGKNILYRSDTIQPVLNNDYSSRFIFSKRNMKVHKIDAALAYVAENKLPRGAFGKHMFRKVEFKSTEEPEITINTIVGPLGK